MWCGAPPQEVDFTRPTAFVLGNERAGVSDAAVAMADHTAIIPMVRRTCCVMRHRSYCCCVHALNPVESTAYKPSLCCQ